jgi:hypothetical protein
MAVKATWHVKLTRGDHARTAFTDYLNRVPKRGAITTLHIDGEQVKLRIDVVREQPPHTRAASSNASGVVLYVDLQDIVPTLFTFGDIAEQ